MRGKKESVPVSAEQKSDLEKLRNPKMDVEGDILYLKEPEVLADILYKNRGLLVEEMNIDYEPLARLIHSLREIRENGKIEAYDYNAQVKIIRDTLRNECELLVVPPDLEHLVHRNTSIIDAYISKITEEAKLVAEARRAEEIADSKQQSLEEKSPEYKKSRHETSSTTSARSQKVPQIKSSAVSEETVSEIMPASRQRSRAVQAASPPAIKLSGNSSNLGVSIERRERSKQADSYESKKAQLDLRLKTALDKIDSLGKVFANTADKKSISEEMKTAYANAVAAKRSIMQEIKNMEPEQKTVASKGK